MSFLNTIFLAALAAAAIPVLLHLLSRQRLPLIPFSSLEFLKRLQKRRTRTVQLRQLILLALRTLAVLALVLAFARPALQSGKSTGAAASAEMVVILDDGPASAAESRDGTLFGLVKQRLDDILQLANAGDRVSVISATRPGRVLTFGAGAGSLAADQLADWQPRLTAPAWEQALEQADSILRAGEKFNRELYIVSPFYGKSWDSLAVRDERAISHIFLIPVGPDHLDNLAIAGLKRATTILQRGQPVECELTLANYTDREQRDALLGVYLDRERVGQTSVTLPAGSAVTRKIAIVPERGGVLGGWVRFEDPDALAADSRRFFVLNVPDTIRVLAVASDLTERALLDALFTAGNAGPLAVTWGDPQGWETAGLAGYDALLLAGIKDVSAAGAARVKEFAEAGGGVVIFPAVDADLAGLGRGLWKQLGFAGARGVIQTGGIRWGKPDLEHPLFQGIFEEKGAPRSPQFTFCMDLVTAPGDQVVIPFDNGRPFLLERSAGRGRVLLFAAPIGIPAGDFSLSGIFAPLLHRSLIYAASRGGNGTDEWTTGGFPQVNLPLPRADVARLILPDSSVSELLPRSTMGGVEYNIGEVSLPGIYELRASGASPALFAANITGGFSDLTRCDVKALADRIKALIIIADGGQLAAEVRSARYGRELWRPLAAAFLLLLIAESVVGRSGKEVR